MTPHGKSAMCGAMSSCGRPWAMRLPQVGCGAWTDNPRNDSAPSATIFGVRVGTDWFPATGYAPLADGIGEHLKSVFLPALALGAGQIAIYMRLLRTDMIATLQEDFIDVARAKGMTPRYVLLRHAFKPSSFSLLTVAGLNVGALIGGAVVIESIFVIGGVGDLLVRSIFTRDYLVIQSTVLVVAVGFVVVNFLVDLLYSVLDPRIRHAEAALA